MPTTEQANHLCLFRCKRKFANRGQLLYCLLTYDMVLIAIHDIANIMKKRTRSKQVMLTGC
jgi:hypothetical protein